MSYNKRKQGSKAGAGAYSAEGSGGEGEAEGRGISTSASASTASSAGAEESPALTLLRWAVRTTQEGQAWKKGCKILEKNADWFEQT